MLEYYDNPVAWFNFFWPASMMGGDGVSLQAGRIIMKVLVVGNSTEATELPIALMDD
jgi:hypothetical protein